MVETNIITHQTSPRIPRGLSGIVSGLLMPCLALVLGGVAYLVSNLIQFHLLAQTGLAPMPKFGSNGAMLMAAFGDILFSGVILVLLLRAFRIQHVMLGLIATCGLFVMMGAHSSAIRHAPELHAVLYSDTFVSHHIAQTR